MKTDLNTTLLPQTDQKSSQRIDWKLVKEILAETGNRIICLDYSAVIIFLSYAAGQLQDDQGDNTNYKAAAPLIVYTFNFGTTLAVYPLLSFIKVASRLLGEMQVETKQQDAINQYSRLPRNALLVGLLPIISAAAITYNADQIWNGLGEKSAVTRLVKEFSAPSTALMFIFAGRILCDFIVYLKGRPDVVRNVTLACLGVFGFGLSETLTFNFFGLLPGPSLGISGLVIGISAQMLVSWLVLASFIAVSEHFKEFHFRRNFFTWTKTDTDQVKELAPLAIAYEATIISELVTQLACSRIAGSKGTDQLAGWNYVAEVTFLSLLWTHAIAQVMQQKVGGALGNGNTALAQRTAKYGLALSMLFPFPNLLLVLFAAYPRALTLMDSSAPNAAVQHYAHSLIPAASGIAWLYIGQFVMLESIKQTETYAWPVSLGIASLWIGVTASYFLAETEDVDGVIEGSAIAGVLGFFSILPFWIQKFVIQPQSTSAAIEVISDDVENGATTSPAQSIFGNCYSWIKNLCCKSSCNSETPRLQLQ